MGVMCWRSGDEMSKLSWGENSMFLPYRDKASLTVLITSSSKQHLASSYT
jgi:hypothetical protein